MDRREKYLFATRIGRTGFASILSNQRIIYIYIHIGKVDILQVKKNFVSRFERTYLSCIRYSDEAIELKLRNEIYSVEERRRGVVETIV